MPDQTTVSGQEPSAENKDPKKVTAAEHKDAVQAVTGQFAPVPPEEQEGVVLTTRDLPSEQAKTETLVEETQAAYLDDEGRSPTVASLSGSEPEQRFARTLPNGKTEAVLAAAPAAPQLPPDDGGYNPEKRTHAGPGGAMTPQAADAHQRSQTAGAGDVPAGWREENRVKS